MKKFFIILPALLILTACNSTTYVHTVNKDGSSDSFHNGRLFWTSDSIDASINTNGTVSVKSTKSSSDGATMAAITDAAVSAAVKSAK